MPVGPGKYDAVCTVARIHAKAEGLVLIVLNGEHGMGFSVQAPEGLTRLMPNLLRHVADEIEASLKTGDA